MRRYATDYTRADAARIGQLLRQWLHLAAAALGLGMLAGLYQRGIGHAYGRAGYGTDIRLACYGLDKHDNDFVVGLIGPQLYPLSSIVQRMRKTRQTSQHIAKLGPFFIGRALWQREGTPA